MIKAKKSVNNAMWIIGCKIVQSLLNVLVTMLTARYFGPAKYGVINYAASIVAFMLPFMKLGFTSTLVQEFVDYPEKEGQTLGTALVMNVISSFVCMLGVVLFASIVNKGETLTITVCALYSINLLFQALEMSQFWFQAKLLSKYTSLTMLLAYIIVALYRIYLLITQKSIYWFAISQALDYMIISLVLLVLYNKLGGEKLSFSLGRGRELFAKSRYYIISSLMITIFAQTDKIMLKMMIGDQATGYYSAAVVCAGLTGFIFSAIIDSAKPVVLEAKKIGKMQYENSLKMLYAIVIYFAMAQSVAITLFSNIIIQILYGADYVKSINILRLIVWYTTFSYLGSVRTIWILAEGKHEVLWVVNLSGAMMNVFLNYLLIPQWGTMGAAMASLVTQIFTNVIMGYILPSLRENNKLMLESLNPSIMLKGIKSILLSR